MQSLYVKVCPVLMKEITAPFQSVKIERTEKEQGTITCRRRRRCDMAAERNAAAGSTGTEGGAGGEAGQVWIRSVPVHGEHHAKSCFG